MEAFKIKEGLFLGTYIKDRIVRFPNGDEIVVDLKGWLGTKAWISITLNGAPYGYVVSGKMKEWIDPEMVIRNSQLQTEQVAVTDNHEGRIDSNRDNLVLVNNHGRLYNNLLATPNPNGALTDFGFLDPATGNPIDSFLVFSSRLYYYDAAAPWTVYVPILGTDYTETPASGTVSFTAPLNTGVLIGDFRRLIALI